jgi:hypothetical protein
MYFSGCESPAKEALLPDGTQPPKEYPTIPPHYASIWVEADDLETDNWWPEQKRKRTLVFNNSDGVKETAYVWEFRIPELAHVTFPDLGDAPARFHCFEYALPKLKLDNNHFEVDLDKPNVIARVSIRGGNLAVYVFKQVASVKWTIKHPDDPMEIKADGYSITLKRQTREVVFSNNSDLLDPKYQGGHDCSSAADPDNHFYLYSQIEKRRDGRGLVIPCYRHDLEPLWYHHSYFRRLQGGPLNDSGCTGTCCSK